MHSRQFLVASSCTQHTMLTIAEGPILISQHCMYSTEKDILIIVYQNCIGCRSFLIPNIRDNYDLCLHSSFVVYTYHLCNLKLKIY